MGDEGVSSPLPFSPWFVLVCLPCSAEEYVARVRVRDGLAEVCVAVAGERLRCLVFRSEQTGIPLHSRGPRPRPGEGGRKNPADFRTLWISLTLPPVLCLTENGAFSVVSSFLLGSFLLLSSLCSAVYNLNILCTYPTQWVEQANVQNQVGVVHTVR